MNRTRTPLIVILLLCAAVLAPGCGKSDKAKIKDYIIKNAAFITSPEYEKIKNDPDALRKKADETARNAGFSGYDEYREALKRDMGEAGYNRMKRLRNSSNE